MSGDDGAGSNGAEMVSSADIADARPPDEDSEQTIRTLLSLKTTFEGPIPPPALMEGYRLVDPDFPARLLTMAEKEQEFRHDFAGRALRNELIGVLSGTVAGVTICVAMAVVGGLVIVKGHDVAGTAIAGAGVVSIAGLFLGQRFFKQEGAEQDLPKRKNKPRGR